LKSVAQRYLIAAVAFVAVAPWLGVGIVSGLECLLAFVLTLLVVGVVQRRRLVAEGGRARRPTRSRPPARRPRTADARDRRPARRAAEPPMAFYDDEAATGDWPRFAESNW